MSPPTACCPFVTTRTVRAGEALFRKGDEGREIFVVLRGAVRLMEIDVTLRAGSLFGEIALFSGRKERTTSAVWHEDGEVAMISDAKVMELCYKNPAFGFCLMRLAVERLLNDQRARRQPTDDGQSMRQLSHGQVNASISTRPVASRS